MPTEYPGTHCDRCKAKSMAFIMSMYSQEWICMDCKQTEKLRADYPQAVERDINEYLKRVEASRG